MKRLKLALKRLFCKTDVSGSCEQPKSNNGDLVPLIWMIEELITANVFGLYEYKS
jgi:hypothetical protein